MVLYAFLVGASSDSGSHSSRFRIDDHVVIQTVKGEPITGTVRWIGPVKEDDSALSAIGIETVRAS